MMDVWIYSSIAFLVCVGFDDFSYESVILACVEFASSFSGIKLILDHVNFVTVLAKNADHDALVDAWSLGCVMAELLTGKLPFAGKDETHHLFKIFDVLGVPCKRVWQAMKPQAYDDEVQVWRARQLRARHRSQLRELFPEEVLSMDGFQVLKGLLTCDPHKRLTAAAALRCPWFTEDVNGAPVSGRVTVTKIDSMASRVRSMATTLVGYVLGLLRPKALIQ
ncbi:unnamed protein product [Urochloa humidicola]